MNDRFSTVNAESALTARLHDFKDLAFDDRYKEPINKSAALLLAKISHEQQIAVLDQLATQHLPFTIKNHETNNRKLTVPPDSGAHPQARIPRYRKNQ